MKVLVISVHPDDETLGCAGALLRHADQGDELHWVVVTQAYTPRWSADVVERKLAEIEQVAAAYGMATVTRLGFQPTRLDVTPQVELIDALREPISKTAPEVVYLIHEGDVHSDHLAVFQAAMSVLKPFYMRQLGVRRVLSYETLSSTEAASPHPSRAFVPNVFVDVGPHLQRKVEIMALYGSEQQSERMPRGASAIRALARLRGATVDVDYAEAFVLIRALDWP